MGNEVLPNSTGDAVGLQLSPPTFFSFLPWRAELLSGCSLCVQINPQTRRLLQTNSGLLSVSAKLLY